MGKQLTVHETAFIKDYCQDQVEVMKMLLPQLTTQEISWAVSSAVDEFLIDPNVKVLNNYTKQELSSTLLGLIDYIKKRQPILTPSGVMFSKPGLEPNPISKMLMGFLTNRKKMKKEMFKYPKGTAEFAKYSLLQLLLKLNIRPTRQKCRDGILLNCWETLYDMRHIRQSAAKPLYGVESSTTSRKT